MIEFSVRQIAQALSTSEETVRRWIRDGRLSATFNSKKQGHKITTESLCRFMEQNPKYRTILAQEVIAQESVIPEQTDDDHLVLETMPQLLSSRMPLRLSNEFRDRYNNLRMAEHVHDTSLPRETKIRELREKVAIHQRYIELYENQINLLQQEEE